MKLTNKMLEKIESDIMNAYQKDYAVIAACIFSKINDKKYICVQLSSHFLVRAELYILDQSEFLSGITDLNWTYLKHDNKADYVIESGYVKFYGQCENDVLEQYNEIEGWEFHSPVLYVNGIQRHTCREGCPCDWEPKIDWFEFAKELPK